MSDIELVKMSTKGQLVVPQDIREELDFQPSDRFVPMALNEGVFFKKVEIPDPKKEFAALSKQLGKKFRKEKVSKKDVKEAVKWARKR